MDIDANVDRERWLTLQSVCGLHCSMRCSSFCVVNDALADGEASLGVTLVLIFQVGTIQDHGHKRLEA